MTSCTPPDAFAPGKDMLRTHDALQALLSAVAPVAETETVGLFEAAGRVLAQDVVSDRAVPPHDNSAVDGWAVFHSDLKEEGGTRLPVGGRIPAGHVLDRPARPGETFRIFTGAPVPAGCDTILPQEVCAEENGVVTLPFTKKGANLRKAGEDIQAGSVILRAGTILRPQEIGLAASIGRGSLSVFRRLKVAIFSTGDEVRDPGQEAEPGAIYDSNRYVLWSLLRGMGCEVTDLGIVKDRPELVREALTQAMTGFDAVLTSGGVSTGEEDHVKAVVEDLGSLHFWRIAIRPGRPLAFGQVGATPFIGLPGNPVATMLTFLIFARPLLRRMMGMPDSLPRTYPAIADFSFKKRVGRREWLRGSLYRAEDGRVMLRRFPSEGSGILTSMVASDGLIVLPEDLPAVEPGTLLDFLPFSEVLG
ncbi:gephyrin-like molybdotransferase Glp [Telmatospirillum sp. J64-1]|uniref:molybdopterin molybdotransferase MoeA n=1 Tax=Telmatospirillum sp. J64-1 TaxID=2502183 RepID=UPI00115E2F2C|nr:gephyrin-like molybdotransferase Glp [Telmatospirillum sp. J64-1]